MYLLGIDLGSTALKAAAFDLEGRQLAVSRLEYRIPVQGPDDWWRTAVRAVRQLTGRRPGLAAGIAAIGLSARGSTRVLLDRGGVPLSIPPGFSTSPESLARAVEMVGSRRGMHGLRFLAAVLQVRKEHPHEFGTAAHAMVAKDYILFHLTGHFVTDPASSIDRESWPDGVLHAPELEGLRLSELRWPWDEAGRLRAPAAEALGLPPGITVATGAHDGVAAAVGAGAAYDGAHPVTLGTNAVYRILASGYSQELNRFWTVLPGLVAYGADVTLGGYAIDWVVRILSDSHGRLAADAGLLPPGADGVVFLPQMGGRVLPDPLPSPTAAFTGMRRGTRPAHLFRAALEGNAFALRSVREALLAQGLPDGPIHLTGGGTRSPLFRRILADVFNRPVRWSAVEEGCRGAAIFAAVAAGLHPDTQTAIAAMTRGHKELFPGSAAGAYDAAYQHFLHVRKALDTI